MQPNSETLLLLTEQRKRAINQIIHYGSEAGLLRRAHKEKQRVRPFSSCSFFSTFHLFQFLIRTLYVCYFSWPKKKNGSVLGSSCLIIPASTSGSSPPLSNPRSTNSSLFRSFWRYVYVFVLSHYNMYLCLYRYKYKYIELLINTYLCVRLYVCIWVGFYIRVYRYKKVYMCMFICTYLCVCVYECVYSPARVCIFFCANLCNTCQIKNVYMCV